MHCFFACVSAAVVALANTASADLTVQNWCDMPVYFYSSHGGACDTGSSGDCFTDPFVAEPGESIGHPWISNGEGTSLKFSATDAFDGGIFQFEYARASDGMYWDVSDIDGAPFRGENVRVTPGGDGAGDGNCTPIKCEGGEVCTDAYQDSEDVNTRFCPSSADEFTLEFCVPTGVFHRD